MSGKRRSDPKAMVIILSAAIVLLLFSPLFVSSLKNKAAPADDVYTEDNINETDIITEEESVNEAVTEDHSASLTETDKEEEYFDDAESPDEMTDTDGDGLPDALEYIYGTDINDPDTDKDGLSDGDEVNIYNTDPLSYDSDSDGVSDGDEIQLGLDPNNPVSDGITPDSKRTFDQHIDADSDSLWAVNNGNNPYSVSIDIDAAGVAENNIQAGVSPYSNAMHNDAIVGEAYEFTYNDDLEVDGFTIYFDISEDMLN